MRPSSAELKKWVLRILHLAVCWSILNSRNSVPKTLRTTCLPNKFMCLMFLQSRPSLGETCIHFLPARVKAHGERPGEVVAGKHLNLLPHILLDVNVKGGGFVGVRILLVSILIVVLEGCLPLPLIAPLPLGGDSVSDAARSCVTADNLWLVYVRFSAHKWEAQLGGFALAGAVVVAIVKEICFVDVLVGVGEAKVSERVG